MAQAQQVDLRLRRSSLIRTFTKKVLICLYLQSSISGWKCFHLKKHHLKSTLDASSFTVFLSFKRLETLSRLLSSMGVGGCRRFGLKFANVRGVEICSEKVTRLATCPGESHLVGNDDHGHALLCQLSFITFSISNHLRVRSRNGFSQT